MKENCIEQVLYVDGYEISATFLTEPNPEVIHHVKNIILSSYIDQTLRQSVSNKVDNPGTARYSKGNHDVP